MIKEPKYTVINITVIGSNKTIAYCKNLLNEIRYNSLNSKTLIKIKERLKQ